MSPLIIRIRLDRISSWMLVGFICLDFGCPSIHMFNDLYNRNMLRAPAIVRANDYIFFCFISTI
jgi:hypothetical protein